VYGAGFTGIELASELPKRLAHIPNHRIVLVENAEQAGPELGPRTRLIILQALKNLGIQVELGSAVAAIDADGVTLM
jgi:NADH dehydrogenase FAD-containing subunit